MSTDPDTEKSREHLLEELRCLRAEVARLRADTRVQAVERLNAVLSSITEAYFALDSQFRFVEVNPAALRTIFRDKPASELLGREFWEVCPEGKTTEFYRQYHRAMAEQREVHFEALSQIVDRWFETHACPRDGRLEVYVRDVTDRKRGEEALRVSEQRFMRFMQHLPGLAWIKDLEGRYVFANDAAARAFGVAPDKLAGRTDDEVFPPETAAQFRENDRRALSRESGYQTVETLQHEDDVLHHSIVSKFPIPGHDGRPALVGGIAIDVTDRLRAEEGLRLSEARFRAVMEQSPLSTQVFSPDGWTTAVNRAWEELWGVRLDQIRDYNILEDPQLVNKGVMPYLRRAFAGQTVAIPAILYDPNETLPDRTRHKDSGRWVRAFAYPIKDPAGQVREVVLVHEDISERKRSEEALREADRRKDEFLAMLAHELRNPLAPIRNSVRVLQLLGPPDPTMIQAREMIDRQVTHMARLVDDLLDVSRITRGKILLRAEPLDLVALVRSTVEDHRPLLEGSGLTLSLELPDRPAPLVGDRTRLAQVMGNLLQNAHKFTDRGGQIHIRLSVADRDDAPTPAVHEEAVLTVADTGIGMDPDTIARLFEPFSQADRSLDRSRGGLGLGLALVKGLVELHGGRVQAASDGPALGSQFAIRLPLSPLLDPQSPVPDNDNRQSPIVNRQSKRVLVVEDKPDTAESLRVLLELYGHRAAVAGTGVAGVETARDFRPDVVLCDIGLPGGMDGYGVARKLRADPDLGSVHLIALTGYGQEEDQRQSLLAGFDRHLTKPVDPEVLMRLLASLPARPES